MTQVNSVEALKEARSIGLGLNPISPPYRAHNNTTYMQYETKRQT